MEKVGALLSRVPPREGLTVGDFGCGKQGLRRYLPPGAVYVPYDYISRSEDTVVIDFNKETPARGHDVVVCAGVLEYLDEPLRILRYAASSSSCLILSYNGFTDSDRRTRNGWKNNIEFAQIEDAVERGGMRVCDVQEDEYRERVYFCMKPTFPP